MLFKRLFKDKYMGSSPENAFVVRTLFDLFHRLFAYFDDSFSLHIFLRFLLSLTSRNSYQKHALQPKQRTSTFIPQLLLPQRNLLTIGSRNTSAFFFYSDYLRTSHEPEFLIFYVYKYKNYQENSNF